MEEIAQQFREELQEIVDRYKTRLSVPRVMHVAQDVFHKTLSVKHNPELHSKEIIRDLLKCLPKENIEGVYEVTEAAEEFLREAAEEFLRDTGYTKPVRPGSEPNAFSGPNAICSQGPDGCCATYKGGWDKCKGCGMYHGGTKCID